MDVERARAFLLTLPHVAETMQWGDNLVFWVGDKAIGGKMFVLISLEGGTKGVASYAAGPERYPELLEVEGLSPAPYFARAHWVAAARWDVFRPGRWEEELRAAYDITLRKLPPKTRKLLALPAAELEALIAARRQALAAGAS